MFQSLRDRLILSHMLPVLLVVPIIGIALIYVLETNILLPALAEELTGRAQLVARLAVARPEVWYVETDAQAFVSELQVNSPVRIELFDHNGRLLASSDPADANRLGLFVHHQALPLALAGQYSARTTYSRQLQAEIADVLYPVTDANGQVVGVIRLSHRLASVQDLFLEVRYLIMMVLALGLGVGIAIGLLLALSMGRSLRQATQAVFDLSRGNLHRAQAEHGPREVRLLLRAVNTLADRLHDLEEARRQLLANLVHELGRPLGAVHSAIWAIMGRAGGNETTRQELLAGMESEIIRLERLLDDLAQLHGQVLGTLELDHHLLDLNSWLPQILITWEQSAVTKQVQWQLDLPPNLPPLEADPTRLAQALGNLVSNAIKFTPEGGRVTISAGHDKTQVWITVQDTGCGIAVEEQANIFNPLQRGNGGGRFPQGMGLGLSIAQNLVTAHNGTITVDSQPNHGSRFTIWLPLEPGKNQTHQPTTGNQAQA
jgi:two-component system sensor histidine kinase BaeS